MKKILLLLFVIFNSIALFAQLEVKQGSFKEVPGFVNINTDKMYDDNDKPYAVLKIKTENINDKQRRELNFGGDAQTFFEVEYQDGEVWLYISYYATFLKISHPDLSSTEFWLPFDMQPKKGYEMTLVNKPSVDEEILRRIENLENASAAVVAEQTLEKTIVEVGYITVKTNPKGAWVFVDNKIVGTTPCLSEAIEVGNHKISVNLEGYEPEASRVVIDKDAEVKVEFELKTEQTNKQNNIPLKQPQRTSDSVKNDTVFSVSSNKTVCFSKGNLQYNESTNTWRFAKHQWDVAEEGWTDLFDWTYSDYKKWYVLSKDEWKYLLENRNTKSGMRFAKAVVNDVNGIILFPDNWKRTFAVLKNANDGSALYSSNKISQQEWENKFEANGAVFLPAAGYHQGHDFRVGTAGRYWSSTENTDVDAYYVGFATNELAITYAGKSKYGFSIRLVCDVE